MQPDANVGGPIVIPKVYNGRNKTFFFFGYQKLIEKKTQAYTSQTPSPDMLAGDFNFGGAVQPIYFPRATPQNGDWAGTRDFVSTKAIPQGRLGSVSSKVPSYKS